MELAPIAIFCYKRLDHLVQVVESLKSNKESIESEVFFFSDGPKNADAVIEVNELRSYVRSLSSFKKVNLICREKNLGLAESIISGVELVLERFEKIIVLEDDIVVSPFFLKYMNLMLKNYEFCDKVASIHGYVYPVQEQLPETFFIRGADCWGWASWKRSWSVFEKNGSLLLHQLQERGLTSKFDFDDTYPYTQMLRDQISGKNNSWAIRWNASAFLADMYTLYPGKSLVQNIGFDGSGTHCSNVDYFNTTLNMDQFTPVCIEVNENVDAYKVFVRYFESIRPTFFNRVRNKIKRLFRA